jgi:hypothetical protein
MHRQRPYGFVFRINRMLIPDDSTLLQWTPEICMTSRIPSGDLGWLLENFL